jgi:protein-disulfide isomerase
VFQNYVSSGKVFYIHHDFPFHQYSHEAARYANAAYRIGEFETVSTALFNQQDNWGANGGIESCVGAALTPAQMARLKKVMQANKSQIDADIQSDVQFGRDRFKVKYTPTTIISCRGQSYTVVGMVSYPILRQFLDELAKR